jgi:2'-5' RNA ligase
VVEIYEKLWDEAVAAFERGEVKIDPRLSDKAKDLRRGVTLVLRPSAAVREAVASFIGRLREICPEQYFYRAEEMHVTVLSIISGTELWQREMERLGECQRIIGDALKRGRTFQIKFRGVTATADSVMVQGFPVDDGLNTVRDSIREAFGSTGLGDMLDRRYRVIGAHMTIMRFKKACADLKGLLAFLKDSREINFGVCDVKSMELILSDWYASAETVRMLEEYRLVD